MQRLEGLIERLEEVRRAGEDAYLADEQERAATERRLQVAVQICIDLGTQLVIEQSARPPSDYADVFTILGQKGVIPSQLAQRLSDAAKQRNLMVDRTNAPPGSRALLVDDFAGFGLPRRVRLGREYPSAVAVP